MTATQTTATRSSHIAASFERALGRIALTAACLAAAGCRHQQQVAYQPPPPPAASTSASNSSHYQPHARSAAPDAPAVAEAPRGAVDNPHAKPVFTEVGMATWYGPQYNHHAGADGKIYDQNALTAAHRTIPLGSLARVTNLTTGEQVIVRITDRGPFSPGRILDLSMGAAKAVGVYRAGLVKVKVEAFAHNSADPPGKWAVQTGVFKSQHDALDLKAALAKRYRDAKVIEFGGPTGYWVRIDPPTHERASAEKIADWIGAPDKDSQAYLVRLD